MFRCSISLIITALVLRPRILPPRYRRRPEQTRGVPRRGPRQSGRTRTRSPRCACESWQSWNSPSPNNCASSPGSPKPRFAIASSRRRSISTRNQAWLRIPRRTTGGALALLGGGQVGEAEKILAGITAQDNHPALGGGHPDEDVAPATTRRARGGDRDPHPADQIREPETGIPRPAPGGRDPALPAALGRRLRAPRRIWRKRQRAGAVDRLSQGTPQHGARRLGTSPPATGRTQHAREAFGAAGRHARRRDHRPRASPAPRWRRRIGGGVAEEIHRDKPGVTTSPAGVRGPWRAPGYLRSRSMNSSSTGQTRQPAISRRQPRIF